MTSESDAAPPPASTHANATPERPWLGLRAYTQADAAYFYGRDAEIRELYERICSNPLTVLYGRSGLGKSSLLGAGLLPKLKVEGRRAVLIRLRFDPDAAPLGTQVHAALAAAIDDPAWPAELSLWTLAHQPASRETLELLRPVLVFDQFEELFTLGQSPERRDQAQALLAELSELIENRAPAGREIEVLETGTSALRVVLTLREDYLHQLERHKRQLPALMRNRMELLELSGPNALQAVLEPARKITTASTLARAEAAPGSSAALPLVERPVAEAIVRHVAGRTMDTPLEDIDAVPPLLSLLCAELNAARIEAGALQITQAQLHGEADQVLERFYQRSFAGMPVGVRRTVEDLLIDNGGRIREASSRDTVLSEMRGHGVEEPERYLTALVDGRLLTIEERAGAPRVELTHDLLVPLVARARERREAEEKIEESRNNIAKLKRARRASLLMTLAFAILMGASVISGYYAVSNSTESKVALESAQAFSAKYRATLSDASRRALGASLNEMERKDEKTRLAKLAEALRLASDLPHPEKRAIILSAEVAAQSNSLAGFEIESSCLGDWHPHKPFLIICPNGEKVQIIDVINIDVVRSFSADRVKQACFNDVGNKFVALHNSKLMVYDASTGDALSTILIENEGNPERTILFCNEFRESFQVGYPNPEGTIELVRYGFDGIQKERFFGDSRGAIYNTNGVSPSSINGSVLALSDRSTIPMDSKSGPTEASVDSRRLVFAERSSGVLRSQFSSVLLSGNTDACLASNCLDPKGRFIQLPRRQAIELLLPGRKNQDLVIRGNNARTIRTVAIASSSFAVASLGNVRVYRNSTGELQAVLEHSGDTIKSQDSQTVAVEDWMIAAADQERAGRQVDDQWIELHRDTPPVTEVVWSSDEARLLTQMYSTSWVWDTKSWKIKAGPIYGLNHHNEVDFDPSGGYLISGNQIVEIATGLKKEIAESMIDSLNNTPTCIKGNFIVDPVAGTPLERISDFSYAGPGCETTVYYNTLDSLAVRIRKHDTTLSPQDVLALADLLEIISATNIDTQGLVKKLGLKELIQRADNLRAFLDGSSNQYMRQLIHWHFADESSRSITPFSHMTIAKHIEREIEWVLEHPQTDDPDSADYGPKILDEAYNLDPGHPLILLALSVFEDRPETKALWKRLSFPRFEKDARLAARAAEILLIDKDPENARKAAEMALNLPTATEADKAKAQAVLAQVDAQP